MENDIFLNKVIEYVDGVFGKKDQHFVRTLHWVCQLKPDSDEALRVAAYSHDVERGLYPYNIGAFLLDPEVLRNHQENGAIAVYDFLIREGADPGFALKVKNLIRRHEMGGTHEQNILKDADSISYFETNSATHAGWTDKFSREEIKAKLDWMYDRISSQNAKNIAEPIYKNVLDILEKNIAKI